MATSTLVRVPSNDDAALIALALQKKGINITAQFWMTPSEPHWKVLGLVSPDRDAPDGYDLYGKIFTALEDFPYADRSFVGGRIMVFGEKKIRKELEMIHAGVTKLSELGPYEEVEIAPIPAASEVHKRLTLDFVPETSSKALCRIFYTSSSSYYGAVPFRLVWDESELINILLSLSIPASEQDRIIEALRQDRPYASVIPDIRLDTLYHLKLV